MREKQVNGDGDGAGNWQRRDVLEGRLRQHQVLDLAREGLG